MRAKNETEPAVQSGCGNKREQMIAGDACCGKAQPMRRFMETCLLVMLRDTQAHGYKLAEQLADFGYGDVNVSTLYRVMRKMEDLGWVRSTWEEGGKGPQRRVYGIEDAGLAALDEWVAVFKQRKTNIETLLAAYEGEVGEQ